MLILRSFFRRWRFDFSTFVPPVDSFMNVPAKFILWTLIVATVVGRKL